MVAVQAPCDGSGDVPRQRRRRRRHRARQGPEGGEGAQRHRQPGGGLVVRNACAAEAVSLFLYIPVPSFSRFFCFI